jgi:hypothetical protein
VAANKALASCAEICSSVLGIDCELARTRTACAAQRGISTGALLQARRHARGACGRQAVTMRGSTCAQVRGGQSVASDAQQSAATRSHGMLLRNHFRAGSGLEVSAQLCACLDMCMLCMRSWSVACM